MRICAITGHRPTRFKFKYKENHTGCKRLKRRLEEQFTALYSSGVRKFLVGGALGVDLWSGEILIKMKSRPEFSDLKLIVAVPFDGHDRDWDKKSQKRLAFLKEHAEVIIVGEKTGAEGYKNRNRYLVDHSDCLIAVYDNDRTLRSGTGQTVRYALQKALPVIYIHPDSGNITYS